MTGTGLQSVQAGYVAAIRQGDFDPAIALIADDVVTHVPGRSPAAGDLNGRSAFLGYIQAVIAMAARQRHDRDLGRARPGNTTSPSSSVSASPHPTALSTSAAATSTASTAARSQRSGSSKATSTPWTPSSISPRAVRPSGHARAQGQANPAAAAGRPHI